MLTDEDFARQIEAGALLRKLSEHQRRHAALIMHRFGTVLLREINGAVEVLPPDQFEEGP